MASAVVSRSAKALKQGPSKLTTVLEHLNQQPRLQLPTVTNVKIRWSARNDSYGARYFVKDALPRIRWANPALEIEVDKVWVKEGPMKQEIEVKFSSGTTRTIGMDGKWSTSIIRELMEVAGGDPWREYKKARKAEGLPLLSGEENEIKLPKPVTASGKANESKLRKPLPPHLKKTVRHS